MTPAEIEEFALNEEIIQDQEPIQTIEDIPQIATQYIEIDVESDDEVDKEEVKIEEDDEDIDL